MDLTEEEYQALILAEVGDVDGVVAGQLPVIWRMFAARGRVSAQLRYLYAKRKAMDVLTPKLREQVSFEATGDMKTSLSDKLKGHLAAMEQVSAEIVAEERQVRGGRGGVVAGMATPPALAPPDPRGPDGNAPEYRGDVYAPRAGRR